ncbi:MAG: ABC transporter ATP-binding protein [Gammaproteobacteria bacterium]|nr:ABC transporter ATP-binding protein [Gammaproteobacteria bacterium]
MSSATLRDTPPDSVHSEDGHYEPVNVTRRYDDPRADINRDQSKNWFLRLVPILLVNRWPFSIGIGLMVLTMIMGVSVPALTAELINAITPAVVDGETGYFFMLGGILVGISVVQFFFGFFGSYQLSRVSNMLEADLRSVIYNHLVTLSFSFYDKIQTGQVISRANSDIKAIQMFLMMAPMMLTSILTFFLALTYMLTMSWELTLASMVSVPLVYVVSMKLRSVMFPLSWLTQARQADVAVIVDENINGQRIVKAFAQEAMQMNLLARAARKLQWVQVKSVEISAIYNPLIESLSVIGQVVVWVYGGWLVMQGELQIGTLVAFNMYAMMIQMPFRFLGMLLAMEQRAKASAGRVFEILDENPAVTDPDDPVDLVDPRGEIRFEDVHFAYGDEAILKGVNLNVDAGETVAIVGATGSGKSTLVRLLARFYEVGEGLITIDGVDIRQLRTKNLHYHVGQVLDEPFLFSISIRENIAYGKPDATMDEIIAAATAANAHEFILETNDGYDTVVGERGYTLSGGQRQRLGIARALLVNPPILVLDDATSAIDVRIEAQIHDALLALMSFRTTVLIAHRLSTINLADRVILLDDGQVLATGTHTELLANIPRYSEILQQQTVAHQPVVESEQEPEDESDVQHRARLAAMMRDGHNNDRGGPGGPGPGGPGGGMSR